MWVQVALKKISNVNSNLENARIVLREVCILRRLCHPHIIELHDAFWKPSPTGMCCVHAGMQLTVPTVRPLRMPAHHHTSKRVVMDTSLVDKHAEKLSSLWVGGSTDKLHPTLCEASSGCWHFHTCVLYSHKEHIQQQPYKAPSR